LDLTSKWAGFDEIVDGFARFRRQIVDGVSVKTKPANKNQEFVGRFFFDAF
jgi:hypothetical protein